MKFGSTIKIIAGILVIALELTGCARTTTRDSGPVPTEDAPPIEDTGLVFIDSSAFDTDLSRTLSRALSEVDVQIPDGFGLSRIPPRLEKWLSQIKTSGGHVRAQPQSPVETANRGLLLIAMDLATKAYDLIADSKTFTPADRYDALLVYDKPTGKVQKVCFLLRTGT